MKKSRAVLIFGSVLAALQFLAASAALADIIGKEVFAIFVIAVGAIQVGWATYQQQQVVPLRDAAAFVNTQGQVVAGPASGVTDGKAVDVVPTGEPPLRGGGTVRDERGQMPYWLAVAIGIALLILLVLMIMQYSG